MSASTKKKLRKEQYAATMTEKQQKAKKEAKKLKTYTFTFIVVMVLVLVLALGLLLQVPLAGMVDRATNAVTIGSHKLSTTDLSYYYIDTIVGDYNKLYQSYGSYAQYFLGYDMSKPLSEQIYDNEKNQTWAEHYIEQGIENANSALALYDEAMKNDHKLTEAEADELDYTIDLVDLLATSSGYSNTDAFLRACYGAGATKETYADYCTVKSYASSYYTKHADSIEYTEEDYREYEKDKYNTFSSYTFATYTVKVSDYLTGEKDSSGNYTAEQQANALEAAKRDAEALAKGTYKSAEALHEAAKKLTINKDKTTVSFTEYDDTLYTNITDEKIQKWVSDSARKKNEVTSIDMISTTLDKDGKEVNEYTGYQIVIYVSSNDNLMNLVDVQHILVKFTGGTTNSSTGVVTYTQAEKNAAREKAYAILKEWRSGEATKESFAELAKTKSDDAGSKANGGLYEDIIPGQMLEAFNDWCFNPNRVPGNDGLVETEHGWHVMYFVEKDERTYRDYMIDNEMLNKEMEKWHDALTEACKVEKDNMSRLNTGLKVNSLPILYY